VADTAEAVRFTDGEGYEKFMGQWSRVAGRLFLDWLSLPKGLQWLDVGCGTGAFTEIIQQLSGAAEIVGLDPSAAQISYAGSRNTADRVRFQIADARSIPFDDGSFDVAVSGLVLNFIPDREKAVFEMQRVVRSAGTVAAYVWDFARGSSTAQHLDWAAKELEGPGYRRTELNAASTTEENLKSLFERGGLTGVETRAIEVGVKFRDFDDYWKSNTTFTSPIGNFVKALTEEKRQRLMDLVKAKLPIDDQGAISYTARVNAVKGRRK
jgi:ubiquinone/menaquinone biosynthesis C-methylase UbiE